jgi:multicomponent Na+:H+ antiporter subunit A
MSLVSLSTMLIAGLAGSIIAPLIAAHLRFLGGALCTLVPAVLFAFFLTQIDAVGAAAVVDVVPWVPSLGVDLAFRIDGFSLLFALLITGIGTLVTLYAAAYMDTKPSFDRALFLFYILMFMSAMLATVLADNLVALFVFWEMTSLLSFLLVGFDSDKAFARKSALQSLLVTAGGGLVLLAGIILIGIAADTFSLSVILADVTMVSESPLFPAIIVLMTIGAFTKSAQAPFHFWLPNAMAAPTPASAYLHSATMVKLGVYLLARCHPLFSEADWFGPTLVFFGGATMLIAALQAIRAVEFKAVLAFSTVASLGTIVMLIGLSGAVAAVATVGFILAHALYKATLFFCAGIVIHATKIPRLSHLGGLARALPLTTAATLLASLSMAGLPPFVGFISKEYLFEASLDSPFTVVAVITGVIVNAVMVAVAATVVLRPFFNRPRRPIIIHHGETLGLTLSPLLLGLTGVVLGLVPGIVAGPIIQPAASAIHGAPLEVSFKLWHGITPMLALSGLVVGLGAVLYAYWTPLHVMLRRRRLFDRLLSDRGYNRVLEGTLDAARWSTRVLQNGDLRRYVAVLSTAVTALMAVGLITGDGPLWPDVAAKPFQLYLIVACVIIVTGSIAAAKARSLVTAIIGVGLAGYGLALIFLFNGGPDIALTQFSVETLFVVIVTAVLLKLPIIVQTLRTRGEKAFDVALSIVFSVCVFFVVLWMVAMPFDDTLTRYFAETSLTEAFGRNVVNVILVDYRALDTFGEIAVIAFAALGAWALLRPHALRKGD